MVPPLHFIYLIHFMLSWYFNYLFHIRVRGNCYGVYRHF